MVLQPPQEICGRTETALRNASIGESSVLLAYGLCNGRFFLMGYSNTLRGYPPPLLKHTPTFTTWLCNGSWRAVNASAKKKKKTKNPTKNPTTTLIWSSDEMAKLRIDAVQEICSSGLHCLLLWLTLSSPTWHKSYVAVWLDLDWWTVRLKEKNSKTVLVKESLPNWIYCL